MSPLDMEIVSLLRNIHEKPVNRDQLIISISKINLEKYYDSLARISRTIPFNITNYIESLDDESLKEIINLV